MSGQQTVPQAQHPKREWKRLVISFMKVLAALWRFLSWIWSILILGTIVGVLGNALFSFLSTGKIDFIGTLTVVSWLNAHSVLCIIILTPILVLTLCSYVAYSRQQRATQEK